jgi:hypothetical protein
MNLLILTIIVHLNNVHLPYTPAFVVWLPRIFVTIENFPAPIGCRINLFFLPSIFSSSIFLYYADPMCNLIFAPPRIFYGYKLLECYLSHEIFTEGSIFPLTKYNLSRKFQKIHLSLWKTPQARRNLHSDTTVMFPTKFDWNIEFLLSFMSYLVVVFCQTLC